MPQPQRQQNGHAQPQDAGVPTVDTVTFYVVPHARYPLSGGREVQADQFGRLTVDEADTAELEQMGLTRRTK